MQLIVFTGLQGSGKSTLYQRQFADTHVRINLDMLKTRRREQLLFDACLAARQPMVIDNTNPTPAVRARYIAPAKAAGFTVIGYYLQSRLDDCKKRNEQRSPERVVPLPGVLGTYNRLVGPSRQEGFDQLFYVRIDDNSEFVIEEWSNEV
jgi:predicted kinase